MKTRNIIIRSLFIMMLIVSFAACASTSKQEGTGDYIDDSVITTKIKSQLAADDFLKSFQISVESRKGIAQLSGFVDSQKAVDRAGQIARGDVVFRVMQPVGIDEMAPLHADCRGLGVHQACLFPVEGQPLSPREVAQAPVILVANLTRHSNRINFLLCHDLPAFAGCRSCTA